MSDDSNSRHPHSSRPSTGRGLDGNESAPIEDSETDSGTLAPSDDTQGLGQDVSSSRREHRRPRDQEVYEAELVTRRELLQASEYWSAPAPSPEMLAKYLEIDPTLAERAFSMAEQSVAASNDEIITLAHGDVDALRRGQWMSFIMFVLSIGTALVAFALSESAALAGLFLAPAVLQFLGKFIRTVRMGEKNGGE